MTKIEQRIFEDELLTDCYFNFSEYAVQENAIVFYSEFSINKEKKIEYVDDKFLHSISKIKPEHLDMLKSRLADGKTLQSIADEYSLTRERVRQIESGTIKKIMILMDRQLIINILDAIEDETIVYLDQLPFKDKRLKILFAELISQSKHKVHFDKDLLALIASEKISFLKIMNQIENIFINTDIPIFTKKHLIEILQSCFPYVRNIERLFFILLEKKKLKKLDDDHYFFQFLYKHKRPMIEFLFSLNQEGLELYKNIDYIKQELDRFFPNIFDDTDRKRSIFTAVSNSEHIYLWDWGKYVHLKYIHPILDEYDFTNVLEYLDKHISESQIDLNLCFESLKTELLNIGIPNKYALHTCLKLKYPDEYTYQDSPWISKAGSERKTLDTALKNVMSEDRVYTLEELIEAMHSSKIRVLQLIDHTKDIIAVDTFQFKQKQFIEFPDQLLEKLTEHANKTVKELDYFYIDLITTMFANELKEFLQYDLRTLVLELFKKQSKNRKFNITNTRIVDKDYPITNESLNFHVLMNKLFTTKDTVSLNEISDYNLRRGLTQNVAMSYFLNSKIKKIVRLDKETFTSLDKLNISLQEIENINLLVENSIQNEQQLEYILEMIKLPKISVVWNRYLLTDMMDNQRFLFTPSRENPIFIRIRDINEE